MVVGRDRERRALAAARSVALVTGPAGVGKTALVASVLAQYAPAAVLAGTARIHSPAPYDWLAAVLSGRDLSALDLDVPPDALAWLAQHAAASGRAVRARARCCVSPRGSSASLARHRPGRARGRGPARARPGKPQPRRRAGRPHPACRPCSLVTSRPASAAASGEATRLVARTLARLTGVPGAVRQHLGPLRPARRSPTLLDLRSIPARPSRPAGAVGTDRRQPVPASPS